MIHLKYFFDRSARRKVAIILLGTTLLLSGCSGTVKTKAMNIANSTLGWVDKKAGEYIDNHEYIVFPWQIFLTEEDRAVLNKPDIPTIDEIDFNNYSVVESILHINGMMKETNKYINDYELYEQNIDDPTVIGDPLFSIYNHEDADELFVEHIEDMYEREWTYPDQLDLVMLEQELVDGEHHWKAHLEWKALQDSNEFLIYPLMITMDEDFNFLEGSSKNPISSAIYTKSLDDESVIDDNMHQMFLTEWKEFTRIFNTKNSETDNLDDSHLASIEKENIELSTLQSMFQASRGTLENASFTGWRIHDKEADALSIYTLSIPTDHEGNTLKFNVTYSRPYNQIKEIVPLD